MDNNDRFMKYIDAELLETELKRLIKERNIMMKFGTYISHHVYEDMLELIDALQQEQPEMEFEDKFANFIEKKDAELGTNTWSEEDLRELALYFYSDRNDDKQPEVNLEETVEFECIGKKVKMTVRELINYYIDSEYVDVAEECGF